MEELYDKVTKEGLGQEPTNAPLSQTTCPPESDLLGHPRDKQLVKTLTVLAGDDELP